MTLLITGKVLANAARYPFPCDPQYVDTETRAPPRTKYTIYFVNSFMADQEGLPGMRHRVRAWLEEDRSCIVR